MNNHTAIDREDLMGAYAHAAGLSGGLSPVPHWGGSIWSKNRDWGKEIYNFGKGRWV